MYNHVSSIANRQFKIHSFSAKLSSLLPHRSFDLFSESPPRPDCIFRDSRDQHLYLNVYLMPQGMFEN